jgi:hypothetical protein
MAGTTQSEKGAGAADRTSRWEDLVDVFIAPGELFRRRADDRVAPALLMLLGATVILYLVLLPANRLIMGATATDPQAAEFMEQYGTLFQLLGVVFVPVTTLAMVAFGALLIWLFAKLASVNMPADRAFLISTYAGFVLLLGQVAGAVLVLVQSGGAIDITRDLSLGPLRFMIVDAQSPIVPLLRRFELFSIWQAALWGVGVRHVGRTGTGTAAVVATLAWASYAIPTLLFAMLSPARGM